MIKYHGKEIEVNIPQDIYQGMKFKELVREEDTHPELITGDTAYKMIYVNKPVDPKQGIFLYRNLWEYFKILGVDDQFQHVDLGRLELGSWGCGSCTNY